MDREALLLASGNEARERRHVKEGARHEHSPSQDVKPKILSRLAGRSKVDVIIFCAIVALVGFGVIFNFGTPISAFWTRSSRYPHNCVIHRPSPFSFFVLQTLPLPGRLQSHISQAEGEYYPFDIPSEFPSPHHSLFLYLPNKHVIDPMTRLKVPTRQIAIIQSFNARFTLGYRKFASVADFVHPRPWGSFRSSKQAWRYTSRASR